MRLFIAIELENMTKDEICAFMDRLRPLLRKANYTRRENLHLTLVFLGETSRADAVKRAMDRVDAASFDLVFQRLGKFRRAGGDIFWMGIRENSALSDLYGNLITRLKEAGFSPEDRKFSPHLTLAREAVPAEAFDEKAFSRSVPELTMAVSRFSLMKSERIGGRLVYTALYEKKLRPA